MERAAAVVVAGIGLVLLTLAALVYAGPDVVPRSGGVELAAVVSRPLPVPASGPTATTAPTSAPTTPGTPAPTASAASVPSSTSASTSASTTTPTSTTTSTGAGPADATVPAELVALLAEISSGGIRFEVGAADLDDGARRLLDRVAPMLAGRDDLLVVVKGHTDSTGGPEINGPLSVLRAQVVADHLEARGVPAARIEVIGLGADAPVADDATVEGRRANRRTEVTTEEPRP